MPTNRKVIDFKIHNLTEEQFQELKEAGQIDPNAIYCTPDETVVNFEEINKEIEAVNTEIEAVNTEIEALKGKGGFPLLTAMWADHTLNDMSWLNADTFSWQSGDVYVAAYEHLVSDIAVSDDGYITTENGVVFNRDSSKDKDGLIAWTSTDSTTIYTSNPPIIGETPSAWDDNRQVWGAYGSTISSGSNVAYQERISNITITYYKAEDGHKICLADQEANVQAIYEATGVAWYYILDKENKRFKLPRTKFGFTGLRDEVGKYVEAGLPNITGEIYTGGNYGFSVFTSANGAFKSGSHSDWRASTQMQNISGATENVYIDASRSSSVYGNSNTVQPKATQMYLYFYVGNFERDALEQTAGINAEMFDSKADINLGNTPLSLLGNNNGTLTWDSINMSAMCMPSDKYKVLSIGSSGSQYTAPADGWFYYSDQASGTGIAEIANTSTGIRIRSTAPTATWLRATILPVKKGDTVKLTYENGGSSQMFRFIYAEGIKHLAQ